MSALTDYQEAIKVAQAECTALSVLLIEKYGKRAGDMRYKPAETPEIAEAMRALLAANAVAHAAWCTYLEQA
jgi:hypothetical protein